MRRIVVDTSSAPQLPPPADAAFVAAVRRLLARKDTPDYFTEAAQAWLDRRTS